MKYKTFESRLIKSTYPGRGIVIGKTPDDENFVQIYWIMGRSLNSRNRIFEQENTFIKTKAFDESKLEDPSLIIYYPSKTYENFHIITNGDQTDTIYSYLENNSAFEKALKTRCFEPDKPNYTPRISGIINETEKTYKLSILKTIDNNEQNELKMFFNYSKFIQGIGHCITTYIGDGNPLPSFEGEPYKVGISNDILENANKFWGYLNKDNRVSLMVKYINEKTNKVSIKIINKNI